MAHADKEGSGRNKQSTGGANDFTPISQAAAHIVNNPNCGGLKKQVTKEQSALYASEKWMKAYKELAEPDQSGGFIYVN
jgi:hypothetical protein